MRLKGDYPSEETIAMRVTSAILLTLLMVGGSLSGCFGDEDEAPVEEPSPFDFGKEIPETTWYHYAGGVDALNNSAVQSANITVNLTGENTPSSLLRKFCISF